MTTAILPYRLVTLVAEECCNCGIVFGLPKDFRQNRIDDKRNFCCPNGHQQAYIGNEASRLRDELANTKAKLDQEKALVETYSRSLNDERKASAQKDRRINGYKGVVARTQRRVSKGRCPCCSTVFKNLKEHMTAEHPHWDPDKGAEAMAK